MFYKQELTEKEKQEIDVYIYKRHKYSLNQRTIAIIAGNVSKACWYSRIEKKQAHLTQKVKNEYEKAFKMMENEIGKHGRYEKRYKEYNYI